MKQYIILFSSIALVVVLHYCQINYLEKTSRYFLTDITDIEQALEREDYNSARDSLKEIEYTWKNMKEGWDSFGEHDDVGQISLHVANLMVYTKQNENTDALVETEGIRHTINHIIESEKLKMGNIL